HCPSRPPTPPQEGSHAPGAGAGRLGSGGRGGGGAAAGAAAVRHHQPARRRGRVRGLPGRRPRPAPPTPPGAGAECVPSLAATLRGAEVEPEILSPPPGRANLVARLSGGDG